MAGRFMPIGDFKVTYTNGETELALSNFRGLVAIERKWPGEDDAPGIEAIAYATWHYLGCPGDGFDEWMGTVHLIEPAVDDQDVEAESADPTDPAVGAA